MGFVSVADHNKKCKMIREEIVQTGYDPRGLFQFLLNVSQFEFIMKEVRYTEIY